MDIDAGSRVSYASFDVVTVCPTSPTLVSSEYEPSEATTLYETDPPDIACSCRLDVFNKPDQIPSSDNDSSWFAFPVINDSGNDHGHHHHVNERKWRLGLGRPNKEAASSRHRHSSFKNILSGIIGLFSDYKIRRRLAVITTRTEQHRRYYWHPNYAMNAKELQMVYEYLRELEHHRRKKYAFVALTLRLAVLELLFDLFDTPTLFSEQRKDFFYRLWSDLDYESSYVLHDDLIDFENPDLPKCRRVNLNPEIRRRISELKQKFFLRVLDELPVNRSISEIIPDGALAVQILCQELAYGSGVYVIQKMLNQIARTEWGHRELLRLSLLQRSHHHRFNREKEKSIASPNLIIDCITKLLSFKNGFSYAMTFRIFGRLAQSNQEVYNLLAGPMGVGWLVHRLGEQIYTPRTAYRSFRKVEAYCHALMAACSQGFMDCALQYDIVPTLLQLMELFTARDEAMHSMIEDNQHDDSDIELDQIACCELIILLMRTSPSGKKQFLKGRYILESFMRDPNRSFSDWKLSWKLTLIEGLLHS